MGREPLFSIRSEPEPATVEMSFLQSRSVNAMLDAINREQTLNMVSIAPSGVCQFCGSYFPAGTLKCANCHGYVKDELVSVRNMPFYTIETRSDSLISSDRSEPVIVTAVFQCWSDQVDLSAFMGSLGFHTLPTGFKVDPDHVLCDNCLCVVEAKSICPNCGGARLPMSEIVKMDRKCAFCGTVAEDGIICKSCNASLAGIAYREIRSAQ